MTDEITAPAGDTPAAPAASTTPAEEGSQTTGQGGAGEETEVTPPATVAEGSQPATGEQEEETFFDPNQVPEALKPAYKQMQAAFTKKTQGIAQVKADAEAYAKYKQYAPILEEMLKGPTNQPATPELKALEDRMRAEGYSEDAINLAKLTGGVLLNSMNQKQEVSRIQGGINEAAKVDPRLNDPSLVYQTDTGESVTFGLIVENLVLADPKWQVDPVAATKRAIARVDALIGKAKTQGKEELSNSATQRARKFAPNVSSPQSTVSDEQPKTIKEAAAQAKKQLGI